MFYYVVCFVNLTGIRVICGKYSNFQLNILFTVLYEVRCQNCCDKNRNIFFSFVWQIIVNILKLMLLIVTSKVNKCHNGLVSGSLFYSAGQICIKCARSVIIYSESQAIITCKLK